MLVAGIIYAGVRGYLYWWQGKAWCDGQHVWFLVLPATNAKCGFDSRLGLDLSSFCMWHCLKLVVRSFIRVLGFPPLLHRLFFSSQ